MTNPRIQSGRGRQIYPEAANHIYIIGQQVRMKSSFQKLPKLFKITATLPPVGGDLQYRIRSDQENHERVTTQDNLEPVTEILPTNDVRSATSLEAEIAAELIFPRGIR